MAVPSPFIWGQGGEKLTPGQVKIMRELAAAKAARNDVPDTLGEGLASVGDALLYNSNMARANEAESAGMSAVQQALAEARASGDPNAFLDVMGNEWASPGQQLIAGELYKSSKPDWQTMESGGDILRWNQNDPNSQPSVFYDGPDAPMEPPQIAEQYDPVTGQPTKKQWNAATGTWEDFGGVAAPKEPVVTVNTGDGSSQWNKTIDENNAKRYIAFQDEANAAQSALNSFAAMEGLLNDPDLYSGAGGEQVLGLKRVAAAMGLNPDGVTSAETFNALSKQAALDVMGGSLGTGFSNADRDFVIDQVANLGNTPEGNRRIIGIQQKIAQRKIEISQLATAYVQKFGQLDAGFDNVLRQYAEENPLFPKKEAGALPDGVTEEDIEHTMKVHGLTREEVLKRIGNAA